MSLNAAFRERSRHADRCQDSTELQSIGSAFAVRPTQNLPHTIGLIAQFGSVGRRIGCISGKIFRTIDRNRRAFLSKLRNSAFSKQDFSPKIPKMLSTKVFRSFFNMENLTDWQFNEELTQHIKSTNPSHWMTIHWHSSQVPREKVISDLSYLHGVVDSARLGPRFHKKPKEMRSKAIFLLEKKEKSTHSHSFWYVEREVEKFEFLFSSRNPEFWTKVASKGEIDLQNYDPSKGGVKYSFKEFFLETPAENIVLSSDFFEETK